METRLQDVIEECQRANLGYYDEFLAVDTTAGTLFLSTQSQGNFRGNSVLSAVERALNFSEPLRRAMAHTTSAAGTKVWRERGMEMSWHYHPDIGLNLSVLVL